MKKINFLKAVAAVFAISLGISSCSKEEIPTADADAADEYVEVSLQYTGEITDTGVSPLSRAGGKNDLYFIKVLEYIEAEDYYLQHAYGLFHSKDSIKSLKLKKDAKYMIEATVVEDGINVIYSETYDGTFLSYRPFWCVLNNSFTYYDNSFISNYIYYGIADMYGENGERVAYRTPPLKRHFGTSDIFTAQEGVSVAIDMASMTFGLKVVAENLTEGSVKVSMVGAPDIILNSGEESKTLNLSLYDLSTAYWGDYKEEGKEDYETGFVTVVWTDSQGVEHFIGERNIIYHRNKIKTIRVRLPQNKSLDAAEISTEE